MDSYPPEVIHLIHYSDCPETGLLRSPRGRLAANRLLLPRRLQSAVTFRVDLLLPPSQHVLRREVAYGAVQSDVAVMLDVPLHQAPRIVE